MKLKVGETEYEVLDYHTFELDLAMEAVLWSRLINVWAKDKAKEIVETEAHDILPDLIDELTRNEWYYIFSCMFIPELTPEQFRRIPADAGDAIKKKLRESIDMQASLNAVLRSLQKPLRLSTNNISKSLRNRLLLWACGKLSSWVRPTAEPQEAR